MSAKTERAITKFRKDVNKVSERSEEVAKELGTMWGCAFKDALVGGVKRGVIDSVMKEKMDRNVKRQSEIFQKALKEGAGM